MNYITVFKKHRKHIFIKLKIMIKLQKYKQNPNAKQKKIS